MPDITITPVILCGGAGSRLWPMSRDDKPKQFHALFNESSLLSNTVARTPVGDFEDITFLAPIVLGSAALVDLFAKEFASFDTQPSAVLLEPSVRDTAAAIAAVTSFAQEKNPDTLLLVLPSDARIDDHEEFRRTIARAARVACQTDAIMTVGIKPSRPETQYGYIEQGEPLGDAFSVHKFREKPDLSTAQSYLDSGKYLWNAGMFMFRPGRMAQEFETLQPAIFKPAALAVKEAVTKGIFLYLNETHFNAAPKQSVDYAIMEKANNIGVVPANFDWDDLGSWSQLYDGAAKDDYGNTIVGDVITVEATENFIRAEDALVAVAGVNGLTIVAEDNKVLVARTDQAHLVKDITSIFKADFAGSSGKAWSKSAIKQWLFDEALPLWAEAGMDFEKGGAQEALSLDGSVSPHSKKRLRVTARQIYCYAHASMLGWQGDADKVLRHCFDTLTNSGWHADGGFIHLYNPDGSIQDATRDTYDQCFVLLAMAWLHRAKGWPEARQWGDQTLAFMDEQLVDPINGGYFEDVTKSSPRRANPHMHFLEAMLAWYEATGDQQYIDRAEKIVGLFEDHFFDADTGTLTERFNGDWSPITGENADALVEPGHHYEWAWLLMRFDQHQPTKGLAAKARALFASANAFGHHVKTGAAADTMLPGGEWVSDNARCWAQTEALKAAIIFEKNGIESAGAFRKKMLDILFKRYLARPIRGGWYDAIDKDGNVTAPDMPSSTFYHVFCALVEHLEAD